MVGREVLLRVEKTPRTPGEPLLEVEDLQVVDDRGLEAVRGVSFEVRAGEIVGIAGVDGNGQSELIDAIAGLRKRDGRHGRASAGEDVDAATRARACSTPASATSPRTASGAASCSSSRSPRTSRCTTTASEPDSRHGWLYPGAAGRAGAAGCSRSSTCAAAAPQTPARRRSPAATSRRSCSRARSTRDPKVLIAAQPTRGLDVGAIEFVHRRLVEERDEGRAVLLVSLELEEILSLSDRILVIYEGADRRRVPARRDRGGARHRDDGRRRAGRTAA